MKKFYIGREDGEFPFYAENFEIKEGYLFLITKNIWVAVIAPGHWKYIQQHLEMGED